MEDLGESQVCEVVMNSHMDLGEILRSEAKLGGRKERLNRREGKKERIDWRREEWE